jgi:SAM-dependent methyltransferase
MGDAVGFFYNTTTQRSDSSKNPSPLTNIPAESLAQPIKPLLRKKNKNRRPTSGQISSASSSSRESYSSRSGPHITPTVPETDGMSDPAIQLVKSISQTISRLDGNTSPEVSAHSYGSAATARVGGGGVSAVLDRKTPTLTSEQKPEQKLSKERQANERAERKAAAKENAKTERDREKDDADSHYDRTGSFSSTSITESSSNATRVSSDPTVADALLSDPYTKRHGRRYLRDPTLPYPLPCDLMELHRQTLQTMLLVQVFGGPVCTPNFQHKHPRRVLEVGCGTGYWSSLCHQYFARQGHSVSFTGVDIAPLCPELNNDDDMRWRFVQYDLRRTPLPFRDEEFDLVMVKDLSLVTPSTGMEQDLMDEYLRILRPGGSLEIWDGDHTLRMLLPHVPPSIATDDSDSEDEEQERANATGTYTLTAQTPLTAPQNQFLMEYNGWVAKALEKRQLNPMPCTRIQPMLLQEAEDLQDIDGRRLAIPLSEVRWEREGVGGAITKDGSTGRGNQGYLTKGKGQEAERKTLSTGQAALRRTALLTVMQKIEALEPLLREVNGKGQDEWDRWLSNMMNDLMKQNGTSWGECLEVGAWWATKKPPKNKESP